MMKMKINKTFLLATLITGSVVASHATANAILTNDVSNLDSTSNVSQNIEAVSINHASVEQLINLKGIGKKKAHAIVTFRDTNGPFIRLDELLNVKGIGKKVLDDNRAALTL